MAGNDNVKNFPLVDRRLVEFTDKLDLWIQENSNGLPLIGVLGAIEVVRHMILTESIQAIE